MKKGTSFTIYNQGRNLDTFLHLEDELKNVFKDEGVLNLLFSGPFCYHCSIFNL